MSVFFGIVLGAGAALASAAKGATRRMPNRSLVRRFLVGAMLGATGSFALACGAFAGHRCYAPAPVVRLASRPAARLL